MPTPTRSTIGEITLTVGGPQAPPTKQPIARARAAHQFTWPENEKMIAAMRLAMPRKKLFKMLARQNVSDVQISARARKMTPAPAPK